MTNLALERVTIIGTGLLGGSVGLALRSAGFGGRLIGAGPREATLAKAKSAGCVDEITTDLSGAVRDSGLVILAAPVGAIPSLLEKIAAHLASDAVVTDVGSTKASIVSAAGMTLRDPGNFVGSHPMAGAETTGPESARADLFTSKPVIVTPVASTHPEALARVERLWSTLGMQIHRMDPAEHDRLVAVISHVPHAASVLLVRLAAESGALPVASTGFADTTRLAAGDPNLWADIFLDNRDAVLRALDEWARIGADFRQVLEQHDRTALLKLLSDAQAARVAWRGRAKGVA